MKDLIGDIIGIICLAGGFYLIVFFAGVLA